MLATLLYPVESAFTNNRRGVTQIVKDLQSDDVQVRRKAVTKFLDKFTKDIAIRSNHGWHNSSHFTERSEIIVPLIKLMIDTDRDSRKNAAKVLYFKDGEGFFDFPSLHPENIKALCSAEVVHTLISVLSDRGQAIEVFEAAMKALCALAWENSGYGRSLLFDNALSLLFRLSCDGNTEAKKILGNLINHTNTEQLVNLLRDSNTEIKKFATAGIKQRGISEKQEIDAAGGIPLLVDLLRDTNSEVRKNAAEALIELANCAVGDNTTRVKIEQSGAVPLLVNLLRDGTAVHPAAQNILKFYQAASTEREQQCSTDKKTVEQMAKSAPDLVRKPPANTATMPAKIPAKQATPRQSFNFSIIPFSALTVQNKILGEGGFGIVYHGKWQLVDVAIKQLRVTRLSKATLKNFHEEAQRHGSLRHPNVLALFGVCMEHGHYSMVMELMAMGSLYDVLHSQTEIDLTMRLSFACQIATGLSYLHEQFILHRDLKSMNVLLDDKMTVKLSDFGLSKNVKLESATSTSAHQIIGTLLWMAPELLSRGAKHTEASDIYALGIIFWEIFSRKLPFHEEENATPENIRQWIKDGEREVIPAETPSKFASIITRCWAQRTQDRPNNCRDVVNMISVIEQNTASSGYQWSKK